jgi:hypothetical protein
MAAGTMTTSSGLKMRMRIHPRCRKEKPELVSSESSSGNLAFRLLDGHQLLPVLVRDVEESTDGVGVILELHVDHDAMVHRIRRLTRITTKAHASMVGNEHCENVIAGWIEVGDGLVRELAVEVVFERVLGKFRELLSVLPRGCS